jgi:hypothetical protein
MTLPEMLSREIERCSKLVVHYENLGTVGLFGRTMIQAAIEKAHHAVSTGEALDMLQAHDALKECK